MNVIIVALGGAVGAACRFIVGESLRLARPGARLPVGTLAVNIIGSLIIGIVTAVVTTHTGLEGWRLLVATGLCGGFTTYSTTSFEAVDLARTGRPTGALAYTLLTLTCSLAACALGWAATAALL